MNDLYVLVDSKQNLIISPIMELPLNWGNMSGVKYLSEEKLADVSWAGEVGLGWKKITDPDLSTVDVTKEWIHFQGANLKRIVSSKRKEMESEVLTFGEKQINQLFNLKYINKVEDIFNLEKFESEIIKLDGWGKLSVKNLIYSINQKKNISLERLIYSLGIRHIGLENAELLSKHFISFSKFKNLSVQSDYEDLLNIDGIGETQVNSNKSFFSNKTNIRVLNELEKVLVVKNAIQNSEDGLLKNKTFLVTGKLNGISRAELKSLIEENSGKTVSSVSKKLNYLIIGDKPTKKKIDNAKQLKINVIDQAESMRMLNKTS